ncbi:hypothetical protein [Methylotuvimicrobium sp. KM2]|uniref:hypothetical protein n=1 Tax=Methylotuvimicrobium sp. KM2 TaxID=3133976 RepID=UPI0031011D53
MIHSLLGTGLHAPHFYLFTCKDRRRCVELLIRNPILRLIAHSDPIMIWGDNAVKREKMARKRYWIELQNKPGVVYFSFSKKAMNLDPIAPNVLDKWFEETVRSHCSGRIYLCRYADDFVCAFQDAERFYRALIQRLARFGLEIAEDKTRKMVFSHFKAKSKTKFEFLELKFFWGVNY